MPPQLIRNLPLTYPPGFPSMSSAPAISIVEDLQAALTLLAAIFALAAEAGLRPRSMSRWIRRKAWSLMTSSSLDFGVAGRICARFNTKAKQQCIIGVYTLIMVLAFAHFRVTGG